ncbi:MAG: TlpA family protein disulfide reductase [Thermoleophilia bacterium]|nr:TlpA family protein disulfide reductase [Thermoleophilia bacterium]
MGKSSQRKRERREGGTDTVQAKAAAAAAAQRRPLPVFWTVLALIAVAGIAAAVVTSTKRDTAGEKAAAAARVFSAVEVTGANLPNHVATGTDAAVGTPLPSISGTGFDDVKRTIGADGTSAQVIIVVAHWCPHCRREVPRITEWAKAGKLPAGVQVTTIATASSKSQANYPPAAWLAAEKWPFDTLADDEAGTASDALGTDGFPFIVFVNGDGTVAKRTSGELPIDEFNANVQAIAKTVPVGA